MIVLYGIKNCDTVKKARRWLEAQGIDYRFHDFRADGLDEKRLAAWIKTCGWETLLNRRGTTWRKLPEADRADLDAAKAAALMLREPTLVKRPVLETGREVLVGFKEAEYAGHLSA